MTRSAAIANQVKQPVALRSVDRVPDFAVAQGRTADALGVSFLASIGDSESEELSYCRLLRLGDSTSDPGWQKDLSERHAVLSSGIAGADAMHFYEGHAVFSYHCGPAYTVANLLAAVDAQDSPVPDDCALEIALGLTAALAAPVATGRELRKPWHGYLVPPLILVSASGEVRPVAYEAGPALARAMTTRPSEELLSAYQSPESRAGQPPDASDDVFAVGTILTHLLTGVDPVVFGSEPPPSSGGSPMPGKLSALLETSMRPRGERFADIIEWQRALQIVVFERHFRASPESVGHLVWSLCDGVADGSSADSGPADAYPSEPVLSPDVETGGERLLEAELDEVFGRDLRVPAESLEPSGGAAPSRRPASRPAGRRSRRKLVTITLLASLGVLSVVALLIFPRGRQDSQVASSAQLPSPARPGEPLAANRSHPASATLDAQASEPPAITVDEATPVAAEHQPEQRLESDKEPDVPVAIAEPLTPTEPPGASRFSPKIPASPRDLVTSRRESSPPAQTPAADRPAPPSAPKGGVAGSAREPEPVARAAQPAVAPATRVGELVELGPDVIAPALIEPPTPRFPRRARRVNKGGAITVGVLVDETGRVVSAELRSDPIGYKLDEAAIEAALRARYVPARKNDVPVKVWTTIRFVFRLD